MGITVGLTSICEVAALFSPTPNIQKPAKSPDCLHGVVTQPTDSRLSENIILSPGFAGSLPGFVLRLRVGTANLPVFNETPQQFCLPNLPNWVYIIGFISDWVLSRIFFCVASQWLWPIPVNCNESELIAQSQRTNTHRRQWRGQQIEQWLEFELFKSRLTLMIEHEHREHLRYPTIAHRIVKLQFY